MLYQRVKPFQFSVVLFVVNQSTNWQCLAGYSHVGMPSNELHAGFLAQATKNLDYTKSYGTKVDHRKDAGCLDSGCFLIHMCSEKAIGFGYAFVLYG
ncbi:hypothetical protein VNO77_44436 [Canavalia gladiata]|uniref:Uncharacterized protein n=1 Tax=Canavalia gladiata TaxID=3824 RepID=A0AAN9JY32_CANGL